MENVTLAIAVHEVSTSLDWQIRISIQMFTNLDIQICSSYSNGLYPWEFEI